MYFKLMHIPLDVAVLRSNLWFLDLPVCLSNLTVVYLDLSSYIFTLRTLKDTQLWEKNLPTHPVPSAYSNNLYKRICEPFKEKEASQTTTKPLGNGFIVFILCTQMGYHERSKTLKLHTLLSCCKVWRYLTPLRKHDALLETGGDLVDLFPFSIILQLAAFLDDLEEESFG